MPTLSLGMIVKNEGDTIERVLGCAKTFCDEMIVVDTGSTDDTVAKARAMGAKVYHFTWIDDFAAARNAAFSYCTQDWIMWLDGDDIITPENQQHILNIKDNVLNDSLDAIYLRYICAPFISWRERIIRRAIYGASLLWKSPIHEGIHGINPANAKYIEDVAITHDTPIGRNALKEDRNINILRKHFRDGDRSPYLLFMYMVESLNSKYEAEAESILPDFLASEQPISNLYEVFVKSYDLYMANDSIDKAITAIGKAITADPKRAEAYCRLADYFMTTREDPLSAIPLLETASRLTLPQYGMLESAPYSYGAWAALAMCYFSLEDIRQAKQMALKAMEQGAPDREWFNELLTYDDSKTYPPLPDDWQYWLMTNFPNRPLSHVFLIVLATRRLSPGAALKGIAAARSHTSTPI